MCRLPFLGPKPLGRGKKKKKNHSPLTVEVKVKKESPFILAEKSLDRVQALYLDPALGSVPFFKLGLGRVNRSIFIPNFITIQLYLIVIQLKLRLI